MVLLFIIALFVCVMVMRVPAKAATKRMEACANMVTDTVGDAYRYFVSHFDSRKLVLSRQKLKDKYIPAIPASFVAECERLRSLSPLAPFYLYCCLNSFMNLFGYDGSSLDAERYRSFYKAEDPLDFIAAILACDRSALDKDLILSVGEVNQQIVAALHATNDLYDLEDVC